MNREEYMEYLNHFNNGQFDKVASYFRADCTLEFPDNFMGPQIPGITGNTIRGPEEFIKTYTALATHIREVLNVNLFISEGRQFCVDAIIEFHVLQDPPQGSPLAQWKKGETHVVNQALLYELDENGKYKRIRIFHHRHLDPKTD